MKKLLLTIVAGLVLSANVCAEVVKVLLADGKEIKSTLIKYSETLLVIESNTFVNYSKKLTPEQVVYFEIESVGRFESKDGIFVLDEKSVAQLESNEMSINAQKEKHNDFWQRAREEARVGYTGTRTIPSNPNEVIGRAFLSTGGVALGIGLPCLAAGLATCIAGNVGITVNNVEQKANSVEASYYLFGVGASLTIISIPLIVHGKRIAEMKVNYTGNGAGAAINF